MNDEEKDLWDLFREMNERNTRYMFDFNNSGELKWWLMHIGNCIGWMIIFSLIFRI